MNKELVKTAFFDSLRHDYFPTPPSEKEAFVPSSRINYRLSNPQPSVHSHRFSLHTKSDGLDK